MDGKGEAAYSVLAGALVIAAISASSRALDNMVTTTVPLLGEYVFGLGTLYGGVAVGVYSASELLGNFFLNRRLPVGVRRKVFRACAAGIALICLLLAVSGPLMAIVLCALAGTSTAIISQNVVVAASSTTDRKRGERNLSIYAVGLSLSLVAGPALESFLLVAGYSAVFYGFSLLGVLIFALSWKIWFPEVKDEVWRPGPRARRGVGAAFMAASVFSIPFAAFSLLPIYSQASFNVTTAVAYSSFVPMYVVSLLVRLYMTAKPFERLARPVLLCMIITLGALAGMYFAPSFAAFLALMALLGIPHGMAFTIALILVARTSGQGERKSANSYLSVYQGLLGTTVPVAAGYLSDAVGIHFSFLLLLVPAAASAAACLLFFWKDVSEGTSQTVPA